MKFDNECNCVVDFSVLENAIIEECKRRNIKPKEKYKIYDYRGYAGISLKHDKVSVHRIIGKYMVGFDFGSEIHVHHIDMVQYVSENHLKGFGDRMKNIVSRNDVTKEKVAELRSNGFTISEIAKELKCGINTVNRRLGMKDY